MDLRRDPRFFREHGRLREYGLPTESQSSSDPRPPLLWRQALGQLLRSRRLELRLTLAQVSSASGISTQYLSEVERGLKDPSSEVIEAVATVLGLSLPKVLVLTAQGWPQENLSPAAIPAVHDSSARPAPAGRAGQVRLALAA